MPCYDARDDVESSVFKDELNRLSNRCKEQTQILCDIGRAIWSQEPMKAARILNILPSKAIDFFQEHADIDEKNGSPWNFGNNKKNISSSKKMKDLRKILLTKRNQFQTGDTGWFIISSILDEIDILEQV